MGRAMAGRKRIDITDKDLSGFKYFEKLKPLFARLRAQIEDSVGGLLALDDIIREIHRHIDGELTAEELSASIRRTLNR